MNEPMLASPVDLAKLSYPKLASPKLDGIRAVVRGGVVLSRKLKPIPNLYVQKMFKMFEHLDGELIVGPPNAPNVMQATSSGVMAIKGEPDVWFYAFDHTLVPSDPYTMRQARVIRLLAEEHHMLVGVDQVMVRHERELLAFEQRCLDLGYEGIMVRDPAAPYKFGRSTPREGGLLKMKRFEDAEARIVACVAEFENTNVAVRNEVGRTKRSTEAAGLVPKDILGAFVVRGINGQFKDVEFSLGGFTAAQKMDFWRQKDSLLGRVIKYKFFAHGAKDAPRHPGFLGFRDEIDM